MKKNLFLFLSILLAVVPLTSFGGTTVDETSTLTWDFELGTDGQTATYSASTSDFYALDDVEVASNWSYAGAKDWRDPDGTTLDTFTGFTPGAKHSTPDQTDYVLFNIRPNADLTLAPTTVTFDCGRYGTGGGMIDVAWVAADGTETSIATGIYPARDKNADYTTFTHTVIDVAALSLTASAGNVKLKFYIYNLDPGKQVGIGNIIVEGNLTGVDKTQTKVSDTASLTWNFELGTDGQVAAYSDTTGNFFNAENTEVASNWSYAGAKDWRDPDGTTLDTFTGFTPGEKHGSPDQTDFVQFNIRPKANLTFIPDTITFDCGRYGTGGGMIDVAWVSANGTETSLATGIYPARDKNADYTTFTHTKIDVSALALSDTVGNCALKFYIYNLDPGKQVGIGNIVVDGTVSGIMPDISSYNLTTLATPDTAGTVTIYPPGEVFSDGTEITLTANRNFGFEFSHWVDGSGDSITDTNPITFNITQDTTINAVYSQLNTYYLDVTTANANDYMVSLSPMPTTVAGKNMYEEGDTVTLTAASNSILTFANWSSSETTSTIEIIVDDNISLTANYTVADYIVGWDFYTTGNDGREADFSQSIENDTAALILRNADGALTSWLDKSQMAAGGYEGKPAAVNWNNIADKYYYQIAFIATEARDITVAAQMLFNYNAYAKQMVEYSLDGVTFTPFDTIEMSAAKTWYPASAVLPAEANNADLVYVRWIPDYTSTLVGTTASNDGTAIAEIYVTGNSEPFIPVIPTGRVAYWKFNEAAGTDIIDEVGLSNGVLSNAIASTWTTGFEGSALDFSQRTSADTTAYVTATDDFALDFDSTTSFSISLLLKADITLPGEQSIISKGVPYADNGGWYHISIKEQGLRFMVWDDIDESMTSPKGILPADFTNNEWVHVVCVRDRAQDSVFVYLNGQRLDAAEDLTERNIATDGKFYIGAIPAWGNHLEGALDELMMYNIALSPDSIAALAKGYGFDPYMKDDVAYWKFDNDSKSFIVDELNMSDGTIEGGVAHIEGHIGDAITFNGLPDTSYVMVPDNDVVNVDSTSFSIAAIVKFDVNADPSNEYQVVFKGGTAHETITAKGNGGSWQTFGKWYTMAFKNGELRFAIDDDVNKSQLGIDVTGIMPADKWVSIIAVRDMDEDSLKLYLNGTQIASMLDVTNTNIGTAGIPLIMGNNKAQNRAFNGGIDELRMFDRALSAADVMAIATSYGLDQFPLKTNANISGIAVNGTEVPAFNAQQKTYTVELAAGTTNIVVEALGADADATVDVTTVTDSAIIVITAQDGETTNQYIVRFDYFNGLSHAWLDATKAYISGSNLIISGPTPILKAELFDINGKLLLVKEGIGTEASISIDALASSAQLLIVRLTSADASATIKVTK